MTDFFEAVRGQVALFTVFVFGVLLLLTTFMPFSGSALAQTTLKIERILPVPTARPGEGGEPSPFKILNPAVNTTFPDVEVSMDLRAVIGKDKEPLNQNLVWRIFSDTKGPDGKLELFGTYTSGNLSVRLPAGYYIVHASYGYAGLAKRIAAMPPLTEEVFELKVGALRLNAAFREGDFIPRKDLKFDISKIDGETFKTIVTSVAPDDVIRLAPGNYHVVSKYGDINSEASADVRVANGELTELTLYQRGAEITLKLVSERGGEALANTRWTVLSPGGDSLLTSVASAFPSMILAAGEYEAFAAHDGKDYRQRFTVESGVHRDVEVLID